MKQQTVAEAFDGLVKMERGIADRFRRMAQNEPYKMRRMYLLSAARTHRAYAGMFARKAELFRSRPIAPEKARDEPRCPNCGFTMDGLGPGGTRFCTLSCDVP